MFALVCLYNVSLEPIADFPEVEAATRIRDYGTPRLIYKDKSFREDAFAFVDSNFFELFTLPLIQGNAKTALMEPNTIVITKALAAKYFGKEDPMGKIISFKDGKNAACKVTGVIDKVPVNSHFHFELFASMASLPESNSRLPKCFGLELIPLDVIFLVARTC